MLVALFGITNEGLNLFVNLVVLFLVVVWIALIAWTFLDARRRIQDPVLVACATGASLFPYVGTVVYAILRPPDFLEDARERQLEIRAAELRVRQLEEQSCPNCGYPIERTYLRCPNCRARVKDPCESCQKPIDPRWTVCPYCETPQRRAAPPPRRAAEGEPAGKRARDPSAPGRRHAVSPPPRAAPASHVRPVLPPPVRLRPQQAQAASGRSSSSAPPTREGPGEERPAGNRLVGRPPPGAASNRLERPPPGRGVGPDNEAPTAAARGNLAVAYDFERAMDVQRHERPVPSWAPSPQSKESERRPTPIAFPPRG